MCKVLRLAFAYRKDHRQTMWVRGVLVLTIALAVYMTGISASAQRTTNAPNDSAVAQKVESYFATLDGYEKGDLITRSQIEKAIAKLASSGMKLPDAGAVVKLGLADDSFLVRELSTADGRRFMRRLAKYPGAFSHLDRLSTIPRGQTLVRQLVREPGGEKLIEYLATTKGGQNMGDMMAQARGGVDLNKPTGRIYTADDLINVLKKAIAKSAPSTP